MAERSIGERTTAADGHEYEYHVDQFDRRWWRGVDDPSRLIAYVDMAEIRQHASRDHRPRDPVQEWAEQMAVEGPNDDAWYRGLYRSDFE